MKTLDEVIALLNEHKQRATYGAVAGIVGGTPRGLMKDRTACKADSWVVAKTTKRKTESRRGRPTGFLDSQLHGECRKQFDDNPGGFISDTDVLKEWLRSPTSKHADNAPRG